MMGIRTFYELKWGNEKYSYYENNAQILISEQSCKVPCCIYLINDIG